MNLIEENFKGAKPVIDFESFDWIENFVEADASFFSRYIFRVFV